MGIGDASSRRSRSPSGFFYRDLVNGTPFVWLARLRTQRMVTPSWHVAPCGPLYVSRTGKKDRERGEREGSAGAVRTHVTMGKVNQNVAPSPGVLSTPTSPWCCALSIWQIY